MNVNGYQDLINKFGNDNIAAFNPIKNCHLVLNKICNCQKQRKNAKADECNKIYINTVNSISNEIIEYFKTKTTDSELVFYYAGPHEIRRIKLR